MRTSTTFNINAEEAQLPLILNGKYFKIVKAISDTKHQKAANGVVAACQERHRPQYDEFLLEKDQQAKRARKDNGSNFVKAFKDIGVDFNSNVDEEDDESDSEEDLPQSVDPPIIRLKKHYRCARDAHESTEKMFRIME
ncbi:hypothetical protein ACLKA6_019796 [Drosophila palustris]